MITDLMDTRTSKQKLFDWMMTKEYIRTSDVVKWSAQNFSNRGLRNAQALAQEHPDKIRRLTEPEKDRLFGAQVKESVWMVVSG